MQCVTRLDVGLLVEVVVGGGRVGLTINYKLDRIERIAIKNHQSLDSVILTNLPQQYRTEKSMRRFPLFVGFLQSQAKPDVPKAGPVDG